MALKQSSPGAMAVGWQNPVRIWESGERQTMTAERWQSSANPLPITQMVEGDIQRSNGTSVGALLRQGWPRQLTASTLPRYEGLLAPHGHIGSTPVLKPRTCSSPRALKRYW